MNRFGLVLPVIIVILVLGAAATIEAAQSEQLSRAFEFRYFDRDCRANGETDFKGETTVFDTEQRIDFLRNYAEYAKCFFNDSKLAKKVVTDAEVKAALEKIKEQPLCKVRKRIRLKQWRWLGYGKAEREKKIDELSGWISIKGVKVENGSLVFHDKKVKLQRDFPSQSWRFFIQCKVKVPTTGVRQFFCLCDKEIVAATVGFGDNGRMFYRSEKEEFELEPYSANTWYEFKIEVDLTTGRYNFYIDGELKADYVELQDKQNIKKINRLCAEGVKAEVLDDIWGVGYSPDVKNPYSIATFIDKDFEIKPCIEGWNKKDYDASAWQKGQLPIVHGGERYAGQDLYLRKTVYVGDFQRAILNVETLDPAGEIWVNGEVAAVQTNRHPLKVDVGQYLRKNDTNLIAVRIRHFSKRMIFGSFVGHCPTDTNIGWFAGRMSLDLTSEAYVEDVFVYAKSVSDPAAMQTRIELTNDGAEPFKGNMIVNFYPWSPEESCVPVATGKFPVSIRAWSKEVLENVITVARPKLWTFQNPNLYKAEVILESEAEAAIDDYVVTFGIRTVSQQGGTFRINGKPEMLNGAQIFGFRAPLDKIVTWHRCAPKEWLAKEILMIKKMNGNVMRIHVHAWAQRSINDPRLAEIGDQMGIMLIWATTAWIRSAECWGIDFEGYPKYMRQVYNHPSIVVWEASNHPTSQQKYDFSESNLFYEKVYETIYPVDPSRLISVTSKMDLLHYGNDLGTIDWQGNPSQPSPAWTAPMVTRGNQDSVTGYGKTWSVLRKWPHGFYDFLDIKSCLDSKERAYFNFEHEESIGQPNWTLVKGKPWYKLQSYEWGYDEGSIGRKLTVGEWQESQAWQAFSAYESMRKQRILDYDGFSWCCLHGGANTITYKKPIIDYLGYAKLAFYANKMAFQRVLAGSGDVDVVYGPDDVIRPVIINLGKARTVNLKILVKNMDREVIDSKVYSGVKLAAGRGVMALADFKPAFTSEEYYAIEYYVTDAGAGPEY